MGRTDEKRTRSAATAKSTVPFDFVRMARRLARVLEESDPIEPTSSFQPAHGWGANIEPEERGYFEILAANHVTRHTQIDLSRACSKGDQPCKARGAADALLEIIRFVTDEHSEEQIATRALRDTLDQLWRALDRAAADLEDYLDVCDERHTEQMGWGRARSHAHDLRCEMPSRLLERIEHWCGVVARAEDRIVQPQFFSMTARVRVLENRRLKLRSTVEAILREEGWLLREILSVVEELPDDQAEYRARLRSLKKRLAGVHRSPPGTAAPSPVGSAADAAVNAPNSEASQAEPVVPGAPKADAVPKTD